MQSKDFSKNIYSRLHNDLFQYDDSNSLKCGIKFQFVINGVYNLLSDKADSFKVLFSIYDITKAYFVQHVWIPNILTYLKYDDQKEQEIFNLTLYLKNELLIEYKYFGPGIIITNEGIKEVEEVVLHPNTATLHFPINILKNIQITEQLIEFIVSERLEEISSKSYTQQQMVINHRV